MIDRLSQLRDLASRCPEVYDDDVIAALHGSAPVPRYALLTCEGGNGSGYSDNPNLTVHDSLDALADAASGEAADDPAWVPVDMRDLETGTPLDWSVRVVVTTPSPVAS